jgi:hypothetical protein
MPAEIEILPGGFVSSKPRHKIGLKGASPFITNYFTIEGFQNLVCYYGDIAWPLLNSTGDTVASSTVSPYFGNDVVGGPDFNDLSILGVPTSIVQWDQSPFQLFTMLNLNGEFYSNEEILPVNFNPLGTMFSEPFTTAGTITVTAGSPTIVGAGTTWTADVLTGGYGLVDLNLNKIVPGDVLVVEVTAGIRYVMFRIISVANNTHLDVWPTPSAASPALGAGKNYKIVRTGYGSRSRFIGFNVPDGSISSYGYYAGNTWNNITAPNAKHGVIECIHTTASPLVNTHYMSPGTVDSAGAPAGEIMADDIAYYKSFLLYGAGPAVSWSIEGFPTVLPFGQTDFPAKNTSVVDPASTFVSFEYLGDQLVAMFEDSMWLVSATGTVPEFTFYKLPELMCVINPTRADPTGVIRLNNAGRPTTSGRGAIFYISNRGLEAMGGGLSSEVSGTVSTAIRGMFGQVPLTVGWDNGTDTVLIRSAFFDSSHPKAMLFNSAQGEWSTVSYFNASGGPVVALTPSIKQKVSGADHTRLIHFAYYQNSVTTSGSIFYVSALVDENTPQEGRDVWRWVTPVIPVGLEYPDFSTGGIIFDCYTLNSSAIITWKAYGGSSPYNMVLRDSGGMTASGTLASPWVSTRQRFGKKMDDAFQMFSVESLQWCAPVALKLFPSDTAVKR